MAEERYLGLDKRHGFFRAIERNQLSRDSYHREEEERKEIRRAEVTEEWRRERRQRRRPDMPHYVPPNSRCSHYLLEVEVAPGRWHRVEVRRGGRAAQVAAGIAADEGLSPELERALATLIQEGESSLPHS